MDNLQFINRFENHVESNLEINGYNLQDFKKKGISAGVAVSGGADSVSLLYSLCKLCKPYSVPVKALTVNHNIRSEEESGGDADYVSFLCKQLKESGFDVELSVVVLEKGRVSEAAEKRGKGTEEAARFLRYSAFESFYKENNLAFVALAHNKNDQIETVLMRFLQGSGTGGLKGILEKREIYVRPLLDIDRSEIEEYLRLNNISFRTDSTNFNSVYLRNRIRHKLVPFLKENFPGFDKALLSGAEKALIDDEFISSFCDNDFWKKNGDSLDCSLEEFQKYPRAVQSRLLYQGFNALGCEGRVPYSVVKQVYSNLLKGAARFCSECSFVCIISDGKNITLKKSNFVATESSFFGIIEKSGTFCFAEFSVNVTVCDGKAKVSFESEISSAVMENIPVPFCIRSRQASDVIETSSGSYKAVSDVLSDFGVKEKTSVPVLQELYSPEQKILAVCGCVLGYKNWILKEYSSGESYD